MKKNTVVIFEDQKIKIPFDIIVDPKKANELEEVTNWASGQKCKIPKFAVAVYDVIKGSELFYNNGQFQMATIINQGRYWFQKYFIKEYYTLLDQIMNLETLVFNLFFILVVVIGLTLFGIL